MHIPINHFFEQDLKVSFMLISNYFIHIIESTNSKCENFWLTVVFNKLAYSSSSFCFHFIVYIFRAQLSDLKVPHPVDSNPGYTKDKPNHCHSNPRIDLRTPPNGRPMQTQRCQQWRYTGASPLTVLTLGLHPVSFTTDSNLMEFIYRPTDLVPTRPVPVCK